MLPRTKCFEVDPKRSTPTAQLQEGVGSCFSIDLPCVPRELAIPASIEQLLANKLK